MIFPLASIHTDQITQLIAKVIIGLKQADIHMWDEVYPNAQIIQEDITSGSAYGYIDDDSLIGYMAMNETYSPEYNQVDWLCKSDKNLIIHRLCVMPSFQGKSIGKKLMQFSEDYAKQHHYNSIRLDAFSMNTHSLAFYEKLGYANVGSVQFRKGQFYCFEKCFSHSP